MKSTTSHLTAGSFRLRLQLKSSEYIISGLSHHTKWLFTHCLNIMQKSNRGEGHTHLDSPSETTGTSTGGMLARKLDACSVNNEATVTTVLPRTRKGAQYSPPPLTRTERIQNLEKLPRHEVLDYILVVTSSTHVNGEPETNSHV